VRCNLVLRREKEGKKKGEGREKGRMKRRKDLTRLLSASSPFPFLLPSFSLPSPF
jgi:hypothetical protein